MTFPLLQTSWCFSCWYVSPSCLTPPCVLWSECLTTLTAQQASDQVEHPHAVADVCFHPRKSSQEKNRIPHTAPGAMMESLNTLFNIALGYLLFPFHLSSRIRFPSCRVGSSYLLILVVTVVKVSRFVGHCLTWWLCIGLKTPFSLQIRPCWCLNPTIQDFTHQPGEAPVFFKCLCCLVNAT